MGREARLCTRCGFTGPHGIERNITGRQWALFVVLLVLGVVPGLIYGAVLLVAGGEQRLWVCPKCGARRASVPMDSPAALAAGVRGQGWRKASG